MDSLAGAGSDHPGVDWRGQAAVRRVRGCGWCCSSPRCFGVGRRMAAASQRGQTASSSKAPPPTRATSRPCISGSVCSPRTTALCPLGFRLAAFLTDLAVGSSPARDSTAPLFCSTPTSAACPPPLARRRSVVAIVTVALDRARAPGTIEVEVAADRARSDTASIGTRSARTTTTTSRPSARDHAPHRHRRTRAKIGSARRRSESTSTTAAAAAPAAAVAQWIAKPWRSS